MAASPSTTEDDTLVDTWHRDGFVVLRDFFPASAMGNLADEAELLARRTDLVDANNLRCRFQSHHETGDCLFETFDPVIDIGPVCRRFAEDDRLLDLLARLYGGPARLFKDKLIFKPPGSLGYRLHQDWIAWPNFPRSFLTVLVPIDEATEENGCTEVFPGHHRNGPLTPEDGEFHELTEEHVDLGTGVKLLLRPGDVAIFGGFTPHRSEPNRTSSSRRQLYLSYNADAEGGDLRDLHYEDFRRYLRRRYAEHGKTETFFR